MKVVLAPGYSRFTGISGIDNPDGGSVYFLFIKGERFCKTDDPKPVSEQGLASYFTVAENRIRVQLLGHLGSPDKVDNEINTIKKNLPKGKNA